MNIIFSTIIAIIILLLFTIFAAWIGKFNAKDKLAFIEKTLDRKEAFIDKAIEKVLDKVSKTCKTGKNWNGNTLVAVNPQPPAGSVRHPKIRQMCREPMARPLQQLRLHA